MPQAKKRASARKPAPKATSKKNDALSLLKSDHREVEMLLDEFEKLKKRDNPQREQIARDICKKLTIHATIEEEILYPTLRDCFEDDVDLLDEAEVEHGTLKQLIGDIEDMSIDDELFDAKVKVLGEYVKHHVKEEENEIFKAAEKADLDLDHLGEELKDRKQELMGEGESDTGRERPSQQGGTFRV